MHFIVGIILILALSLMPASGGSGVKGSVTVQTGTQGTSIGIQAKTDGNPSAHITIGTHYDGD